MSSAVSLDPSGPPAASARAPIAAGPHPEPSRRARWWVELLVIGWLLWVYDAINNLAPLRLHAALTHARHVLELEQTLHIDPEHALDRWLAGHHTLGLIVSDYYDNAHFIVTLGLLGFMWWRRSDIYRRMRSTLVIVNLLGFLVFWLYPVAPPRMLRGFTDVVAATGAIGSWHTGSLASQANELAAMPSLHIAWAGWCTVVVWKLTQRRWLRAVALAYPFLTVFAVLSTGNHFVLDVIAGAFVLVLALALARVWQPIAQAAARGLAASLARVRPSATPAATVPRAKTHSSPAYRMSQSCYEVRERVD